MGRHKTEIDWEKVDQILMSGAGSTTVSRVMGISVATVIRACLRDNKVNFDTYRQQKIAQGDEALLRKAYQMAITGDKTLLIFLLKNRCGYADRSVVDQTNHLPEEVEKRTNDILDKIEAGLKELDE